MTFLEALTQVRPLIKGRQVSFICDALYRIGAEQYQPCIQAQLDGCRTYASWVRKHHPEIAQRMDHTPDAWWQGRLQWIDHMIAQERTKPMPQHPTQNEYLRHELFDRLENAITIVGEMVGNHYIIDYGQRRDNFEDAGMNPDNVRRIRGYVGEALACLQTAYQLVGKEHLS